MSTVAVLAGNGERDTQQQDAAPATDVYAVHGADPEILAYAMAKYSRSSLTLRESLKEISASRAEQFLNTFYFAYGHRSIADLAHVAFAVERLSLLAAIELVDEQRWDGQERSTRYQNFRKSGWYTPQGLTPEAKADYTSGVAALFDAYEALTASTLEHLKSQVPRPDEMKPEAYERTLKARAFDVARYLLPLATNTSLGQIVNARTLETQVSRLLSSEYGEVRDLGERLREAAKGAAWDTQAAEKSALLERILDSGADEDLRDRASAMLLRETHVAPTLVKYATPNAYQMESRRTLREAAASVLGASAISETPLVDLVEPLGTTAEALEIEIAASLLYPECHYAYRQVRDAVAALDGARRSEILALGTAHRGRHDELSRAYSAGHGLRFDILMDIGGFRDMHRHRRCVQLRQQYTSAHGYDLPENAEKLGIAAEYRAAADAAIAASKRLASANSSDAAYLLPLGVRCRSLFAMDFAEAVYISELRSQQQGHWSYRRVAWEMHRAIAEKYPALAGLMRVTDIHSPVDMLKR